MRLPIDTLLELIGAALVVLAVYLLAGMPWAVLAGGVAVIVAANFTLSGLSVGIRRRRQQ